MVGMFVLSSVSSNCREQKISSAHLAVYHPPRHSPLHHHPPHRRGEPRCMRLWICRILLRRLDKRQTDCWVRDPLPSRKYASVLSKRVPGCTLLGLQTLRGWHYKLPLGNKAKLSTVAVLRVSSLLAWGHRDTYRR